MLPKPNYHPLKIKRANGIKSLIDIHWSKESNFFQLVHEKLSLQALAKEKKIVPG